MIIVLVVLVACFAVSTLLTRYLITHANQRQFLDIPNDRSSHSTPTPTGGGLSIVFTFILFLLATGLILQTTIVEVFILALTGAVLAVVGYIDDHRHIPAQWRLLIHFLVALALFLSLDNLPGLSVLGWQWQGGWLFPLLSLVSLVWLLNLFNFMDGIDGIAGAEAITSLCSAALILWIMGAVFWPVVLLALASSVSGFLVYNWPPAKIFMGDAGSGFLGFMLGALALITSATGFISLWSWIILLAVFIGDSTATLIRRAKRGEKIHQAHRSHAYQVLSRKLEAHLPVTCIVLLVNLTWLLPLALGASLWPSTGLLFCLMAYVPLLWAMYKISAGKTNC